MKKIINNKKGAAIIISAIAIVIVLGFVAQVMEDVNGVEIKDTVAIDIKQGSAANSIINQLKDNNIIKYPQIFKLMAKSSGKIQQFKPGRLTVSPDMTYKDIIDLLTQSSRNVVKVTIPEGYEIRQIIDKLEQSGLINRDEFINLLKAENFDYKFLEGIPDRENQLEGYLFPDTYIISEGTSEKDIINMMLEEFNKNFPQEYYERAKELDMTVDEVVTLASIIERETSLDEERAMVSGVFHNRINDNMRLQSCATVEYILKERKSKLSTADTKIDSKYNTYRYSGLPIGPIASAGAECIKAALYPAQTTAKYFVLGKDGKHVFSDTYEAHLDAKSDSMYN